MIKLSPSEFTKANSGRVQLVCDPVDPPHGNEEKWSLDKDWEIMGYTDDPPMFTDKHEDGCYIGVMFLNKQTGDKAWFHWHKDHVKFLPISGDL